MVSQNSKTKETEIEFKFDVSFSGKNYLVSYRKKKFAISVVGH